MKSLEEFIEAGSAKELVEDKNYRSVALETAAEILRVARELSYDRGRNPILQLCDLEKYINSTNTEGGDGE